jgi:hypothetical protein
VELELDEFVARIKTAAGISMAGLSSRSKNPDLVRQRIELASIAIGRYRFRVCDIAALVRKHPNSVAKWLNKGLRLERSDPEFKVRLDHLDAAISGHR